MPDRGVVADFDVIINVNGFMDASAGEAYGRRLSDDGGAMKGPLALAYAGAPTPA